jgi:hypothetical protein
MKIKSYPGYAIDASQEHSNKIELLYKANWETTFKNLRIRSSQHNEPKEEELRESPSQSFGDKRLFIQHPRVYGHQTLRVKNIKPKPIEDWIDFDLESSTNVVNPLYNHTQNNWHSQDYLQNLPTTPAQNSNKSNKIQRSQTVIVKQPTFSREVENLKDPNALIKRTNTFWRNNFSSNNSNNNNFTITSKRLDTSKTSKSDNDELYVTESCCDESIGTSKQEKESYFKRGPYDKSASSKSYEESRHNTYNRNRMHCYETASNATSEYVENLQKHGAENKPMASKILLNPLAQNKNIQINHLDLVSINELSDLNDYDVDGKSSKSSKSPKKEKRKGLSRMFYNTISAGSKLPKVFLNRPKTQRAALDIENYSNENTSDISSNGLSTTTTASASSSLSATSSSKSSVGQNCDKFSIPRPRLITPVHTYTRKRRTGNLTKTQNFKDDLSNNNNKNAQGKKVIFIRIQQYLFHFQHMYLLRN